MSTHRQSETARANGAQSHGPVTPQGRATSSRNSLRHGLSSQTIVLPGESAEDFQSLIDSYIEQFQPAGAVEADLVQTLAAARWRLRRLQRMETEMFELEMLNRRADINAEFTEISDTERVAWVFQKMANEQKCLNMVLRYEGTFTRSYDRAFKQLQILQSARSRAQQNEPKPAPTRPDAAATSPALTSAPASEAPSPAPLVPKLDVPNPSEPLTPCVSSTPPML